MVLNLSGIMCHELAKTNELPEKYKDLACGPKVIGLCYDKNGNVIEDCLDFDYTGKHKSTVFLMKDAVSIANTPFKWSFKVTHWNGTTWNTGDIWLALSADYWFEYKHACILYASGTEILRAGQTYGYSFDFEMENKLSVDSLLFHYTMYHNGDFVESGTTGISKSKVPSNIKLGIKGITPNYSSDSYQFIATLHGSRLEVNGKLVFSRD